MSTFRSIEIFYGPAYPMFNLVTEPPMKAYQWIQFKQFENEVVADLPFIIQRAPASFMETWTVNEVYEVNDFIATAYLK